MWWRLRICILLTLLLIVTGESSGRTFGWSTPLHFSVERGQIEKAKLLLKQGADVNAIDFRGKTPLSLAAGKGHPAVERLMREHGGKE